MKKLYKFALDCGRMGSLRGVFVAEVKDVERMLGSRVYFGEVLGKHSDISATITGDHVVPVTDDAEFIRKFEELQLATGYNPLHYYDEEGT